MGDPVTAAIVIGGTTAAMGTLSYMQAKAQNDAIRQSMAQQQQAAQAQTTQAAELAGVQQQQIRNEANMIRGSLRVARSGAGTGSGTTAGILDAQVTYDEAMNLAVNRMNLRHQAEGINSGLAIASRNLANQTLSPITAATTGGLQGINTGLNIVGGVQGIQSGFKKPSGTTTPAAGSTS